MVSPESYATIVERLRAAVVAHTPPEAIVLVVSRGDAALLDLSGRTGWHFPRTPDGEYAGYHPRTGQDALEHLLELHGQGARYLALPQTCRWWLEHYVELWAHLSGHGALLWDDQDGGLLYALEVADAVDPRSPTDGDGFGAAAGAFRDYVSALVPRASRLVVLAQPETGPELGIESVFVNPAVAGSPAAAADMAAILSRIDAERARGADFLLVPGGDSALPPRQAQLSAEIARRYRLVGWQPHLCRIFSLAGSVSD